MAPCVPQRCGGGLPVYCYRSPVQSPSQVYGILTSSYLVSVYQYLVLWHLSDRYCWTQVLHSTLHCARPLGYTHIYTCIDIFMYIFIHLERDKKTGKCWYTYPPVCVFVLDFHLVFFPGHSPPHLQAARAAAVGWGRGGLALNPQAKCMRVYRDLQV